MYLPELPLPHVGRSAQIASLRRRGESQLLGRSNLGEQGAVSLCRAAPLGRGRVSLSAGSRDLLHQAAGRFAERNREDSARRRITPRGSGDAEFSLAQSRPRSCAPWPRSYTTPISSAPRCSRPAGPRVGSGVGDGAEPGAWQSTDDTRKYELDGTAKGASWLRYEHTVPPESFWRSRAAKGTPLRIEPRAELITDFYAFNTRVLRGEYGTTPSMLGLHWVGDLILDGDRRRARRQGFAAIGSGQRRPPLPRHHRRGQRPGRAVDRRVARLASHGAKPRCAERGNTA